MSRSAEAGTGEAMYDLAAELFPICRSITGQGIRESIERLADVAPIEVFGVPTGTPAFDWAVPREWNIRDAWIADASGKRIVDFRESSLHVVNYSVPFRGRLSLAELRPHLHSLPEQPELIPYRTSYYSESWGFCLSHRQLESLADGEYDVCIDSTLEPGSLVYGECLIEGAAADQILISTHCCHPSLANDNLSGMVVAAYLARHLAERRPRHTVRLLFIPGTIGSITWLAQHQASVGNVRAGLVLSCLGDAGSFTYKRSRRGDTAADRAATHVLRHLGAHRVVDFEPYGYDERQFCSPGFDLPVGCLTRSRNGEFPEYHTSADNLSFISPAALQGSLDALLQIIDVLDEDGCYVNLNPHCEPQLGRRGLYRNTGGHHLPGFEMALLWVLNLSDGRHTLLDIAERANMPFATIRGAATALEAANLLRSA